jgi:hypothetical protein
MVEPENFHCQVVWEEICQKPQATVSSRDLADHKLVAFFQRDANLVGNASQ